MYLDVLSLVKGWKYAFPYFEENIPLNNSKYYTIFDTTKQVPEGMLVYASVSMSTANFNVKISAGDVTLHELPATALLYGQASAGSNVPAGLVANVYVPLPETNIAYPIGVFNPAYPANSTLALYTQTGFPFIGGIKLQVRTPAPPQTIYEVSLGVVNIDDKQAYLESLQEIFAGKGGSK